MKLSTRMLMNNANFMTPYKVRKKFNDHLPQIYESTSKYLSPRKINNLKKYRIKIKGKKIITEAPNIYNQRKAKGSRYYSRDYKKVIKKHFLKRKKQQEP